MEKNKVLNTKPIQQIYNSFDDIIVSINDQLDAIRLLRDNYFTFSDNEVGSKGKYGWKDYCDGRLNVRIQEFPQSKVMYWWFKKDSDDTFIELSGYKIVSQESIDFILTKIKKHAQEN